MDPRQPSQHPFSSLANTSPYTRNPPYATPGQPYPPSSHAPSANSSYPDHHRRPSDPPYASYGQHRAYSGENQMRDGPMRDGPVRDGVHRESGMRDGPLRDGPTRDTPIRDPAMRDGPLREAPMRESPMSGHSRHQSSSSVGHTPVNRGMPPPSSPQQNPAHRYSQLPPTRAPASGPPNFGSGRELPALGAAQGHTSRVSIADLLGGPSSASREPPERNYGPASTASSQNPTYAHASPRITTAPDYAPFRRPTTPEHARPYEPRDHRANSAGSPPRPNPYSPEARRYGTPQTYGQRAMADERREPPNRAPNTNASVPPRPSSQPGSYNSVQRSIDPRAPPAINESIFGRQARSETLNREAYRSDYEERHNAAFAYAERARQEREAAISREREQREQREQREKHEQREQQERRENEQKERDHRARLMSEHALQQDYANKMAAQRAQTYTRAPEPREQPAWLRHGYEPPRPEYEPIPEQQPHQREPLHNYPRTTAPSYGGHPAYSSNEHRFPPASQPTAMPIQHSASVASPFEAALQQERSRVAQQQQEEQQQQRAVYGGPPSGPAYQQESPAKRLEDATRRLEEAQQLQQVQRSFLGVQEMNRKGRISPLPQAVQGAQGQIGGPGGEPQIKHEFGRMFSGIGSGVGAMEGRSPVTAGPQALSIGQLRREELEGFPSQDSPIENGGYNIARSSSRGGRRRKLKDEDGRGDDDSSTGRRTPSGNGRGKRLKHHHGHRHGQNHHQHYHRVEQLENVSSPLQPNHTPFKIVRGAATVTSPPDAKAGPGHHHHAVRHHHHHQATPTKPDPPKNIPIPAPKVTIRSKAVLDSVAHRSRNHLGHAYYQSDLSPVGKTMNSPRAKIGFASTPRPLPLFEGSENSTFTIRVPHIHLTDQSRREITARRAIWGTDVYTDDSDVIAACIHHGWFRGCWAEDVDVSLLGLELNNWKSSISEEYLTEPPKSGPVEVPKNKDLHVTILILPKLEKYSSMTRFGMRSREWGAKREGYRGQHDGLSFMILNVRWVDDGLGFSRSAKKIKKLRPATLEEWEIDAEREWGEQLLNGSKGMEGLAVVKESFERGGGGGEGRFGDLRGVGGKSWWVKPVVKEKKHEEQHEDEKEKGVEKEGGKEEKGDEQKQDGEDEIQSVARKMSENVNGHLKENAEATLAVVA